MKASRLVVLALFLSARALGAGPDIEFSAVLSTNGRTTLALADKSGGTIHWVEVGGSFAGFAVKAYDAREETALLANNETQLRLHLVAAKVASPDATLSSETIQAIIANLRQLITAANRFYLDNERASVRFDELVGPDRPIKELKSLAGENYASLLLILSNQTFSVTTANGTRVTCEPPEPPPVLREYIVRAGDTFSRIARDTGISVQQLVEFNSGVNSSQIKVGQKLRLQ